jgi:hypothetical protein
MKTLKLISALGLMLVASAAFAQDFPQPKQGAKIYLESNQVELAANGTTTFNIYLVRSTQAKATKFDLPRFLGQEGLTFDVQANPEKADNFKVSVSAAGVAPGSYSYSVACKSFGVAQVTGTTVSLVVTDGAKAVTQN